MPFTLVGQEVMINAITKRVNLSSGTLYVALLLAAPNEASSLASLSEYTATGYARAAVTWGAPAGTPRTSSNTSAVTFGPFTGANGAVTIPYFGLVTVPSGTAGELWGYDALPTPRTPNAGDTASYASGELKVRWPS